MNTYRLLFFVLSTAMLMWCTEAAQAQVSVALPDVTGDHGDTIDVAVAVGSITGQNVTSYGADVIFDPAVIDIIGFEASGTIAEQFSNVSNKLDAATFRIGGFTSGGEPATGSGTFVILRVELLAPGTSSLGFASFEFNDGTPAAQTTDGSVTVVVDPVVATNVGLTVDEGGSGPIGTTELETTDLDSSPSDLTYTIDAAPTVGELQLDGAVVSAGGTFTQADIDAGILAYTHDGSESTSDGFEFTVTDPDGLEASGTFEITINPVNDPPVFTSEPVTSIESDQTYSYDVTTEDMEGSTPILALTSAPAWLSLTDHGDGTGELGGIPALADVGDHNVVLTASDGVGGVTEQSFAVSVSEGPDADGIPDAVEDAAPNGGDGNDDGVPDRDQAHVASLPNATTGAYMTIVAPDGTTLVNVEVTSDTPDEPMPREADLPIGLVAFDLEGLEPGGDALVTVLLAQPIAVNSYWKFGATGGNPEDHWYDFQYDGNTGAELVADEATGEVAEIRLHLIDGERGDHDLAQDGRLVDPGAPVMVENAAPVAADDDAATSSGEAVVVNVLSNDSDSDGDALRMTDVAQPAEGIAEISEDDTFVTYTPPESFAGSVSFVYEIEDVFGESAQATVTVSVNGAPLAADDSVSVEEDTSIDVDVLANDSDPNDDPPTLTGLDATERFEIVSEDGEQPFVRLIPETDSTGIYVAWYTISDGEGLTDSARVVVSVLPVNDAPRFEAATTFVSPEAGAEISVGYIGDEEPVSPDAPLEIDWNGARDPEGDEITYEWQLAANESFEEPIFSHEAGTSTSFETTVGSLLDRMREHGIEAGTTGTFYQRLIASDGTDTSSSEAVSLTIVVGTATSVGKDGLPEAFELNSNYPNPFNPVTRIEYAVPEAVHVTLTVYNTLGREVATLVNASVPAGRYSVTFDASGLASGLYLYRIEAGSFSSVRQMILMK